MTPATEKQYSLLLAGNGPVVVSKVSLREWIDKKDRAITALNMVVSKKVDDLHKVSLERDQLQARVQELERGLSNAIFDQWLDAGMPQDTKSLIDAEAVRCRAAELKITQQEKVIKALKDAASCARLALAGTTSRTTAIDKLDAVLGSLEDGK